MNVENIEEVFWKLEDGKQILLTELEEEHFKKAYLVIQRRQLKAFSTLEMCNKMENAMIKIAKKRNVKLLNLEETNENKHLKNKYIAFKDIIDRINRSIKLRLNKNAKARKPILQKASNVNGSDNILKDSSKDKGKSKKSS